MPIDIKLAEIGLALISFGAGTIVPWLHRRLSFDGIAIKQPYNFRATRQDDNDRTREEVMFGTIVKIANVRKQSILIDDVAIAPLKAAGVQFTPIKQEFEFVKSPDDIVFPMSYKKEHKPEYLPLILRSDQEWLMPIEILFKYSGGEKDEPFNILSDYIESHGLKISFRINGKYRKFNLTIRGDE